MSQKIFKIWFILTNVDSKTSSNFNKIKIQKDTLFFNVLGTLPLAKTQNFGRIRVENPIQWPGSWHKLCFFSCNSDLTTSNNLSHQKPFFINWLSSLIDFPCQSTFLINQHSLSIKFPSRSTDGVWSSQGLIWIGAWL